MQELAKYTNGGELFDGHYRLIKLLSSEGGTADVWLAENYESVDMELSTETDDFVRLDGTGVLVAIKIYRPKNLLDVDGEQKFRAEFKTIFNCHHTNLLPTTDYSVCDGMPYLVMPFCENGSVESLVGKLRNEDEIWKFVAEVASGLDYLHTYSPPIIHQDIKPANILIDTNKNYCITDFGISVKFGIDDERFSDNESSGTTIYMPPERFVQNKNPDTSSDIWAFGATLYELLTGDVPFGDHGGAAQLEGQSTPPIKVPVSRRIKKIVYACLDPNPQKRPTAKEIVEYAYTRGKKQHYILGGIFLFILISAFVSFLLMYPAQERPDAFTVYRDSGDSILSLLKHENSSAEYVNYSLSLNWLKAAAAEYSKALNEPQENKSAQDSLYTRMARIQNTLRILEDYKGVCDTLDLVINDNLPIQIELYSKKKDRISQILKDSTKEL